MTVLIAVETVVLVLLAVLVVGLLRSHADILRRLHELDGGREQDGTPRPARAADHGFRVMPGTPTPGDREGFTGAQDLSGVGVGEDAIAIRVTGVEHDTVVAFLSSGCLTCSRFWDAFAQPDRLGLRADTRLVVVTKDPAEDSPSKIAELAPAGVPLVMSSAAWADYDVPGSPYFVLVDGPSGAVRGEGTGMDWDQVSGLLAQATDDLAHASGSARRPSKAQADAEREARIDRELLNAGVRPGDETLYPDPVAGDDDRRPR
ncbi:hypothetical protein BH24ACT3_BH24ACT3_09750 [soil metagenome]